MTCADGTFALLTLGYITEKSSGLYISPDGDDNKRFFKAGMFSNQCFIFNCALSASRYWLLTQTLHRAL